MFAALICPRRFGVALLSCLLLAGCGQDEGAAGDGGGAVADVGVVDVTDDGGRIAPGDAGGAKVCDCDPAKDTACTWERCDPKSGDCVTTPRPAGTVCDDGDPCTVTATCEGGACKAGPLSFCTCTTSADCKAQEDGDLCNGTLFCDKGSFPWRCEVNPATVVTCKGGGDACTAATCNPATGACSTVKKADDTVCDDGDACTKNDRCKGGVCTPSVNVCTCTGDADCALLDDEDQCNGKLYCDLDAVDDKGNKAPKCKVNPATVVSCTTGADTACAKSTCQPKTGQCELVPTAGGSACDDGDKCTTDDVCFLGKCVPGTNTCLCTSDAECEAKHGDGDLCNGTLFCNKVNGLCQVNPATKVTCPSAQDTACSQNTCETLYETKGGVKLPKAATCTMVAVSDKSKTPCDDSDPCTKGDVCKGGQCASGTYTCFCASDKDCAAEEDGDACNGTLFCDKTVGKCLLNPASVVSCPSASDNACRKNTCDKKSGQCKMDTATFEGAACEDGSPCTKSDYCVAGTCKAGTFTCECNTDADCVDSDGDQCNGVPYCDKSGKTPKCKPNPASVVFCSKAQDTACLKAACDPKTGKCGLQPTKKGASCDDDNPCTAGDACDGGSCVGPIKADCADNNACTIDLCDKKLGCVHKLQNCADGNSCTVDKCHPKTGACDFSEVLKDGTTCNADNDGCTVNDTCSKGVCKVGSAVKCTLATKACETTVCKSEGQTAFKCLIVGAPDGASCDDDDSCTIGAACKGGSCQPGKDKRLWSVVAKASGEVWRHGAVAPLGKASAVASGRLSMAGGKVSAARVVVTGHGESGKAGWSFVHTAAAPLASVGAAGLHPLPGGGLVLTGTSAKAGKAQALFVKLDGGGKAVAQQTHAKWDGVVVRASTLMPDEGVVMAGVATSGGAARAAWLRTSASGHLSGATLVTARKGDEALAVDGIGGNQVVVVGQTGAMADKVRRGFATRVDANGKAVWTQALSPLTAAKGAALRAVATWPSDGLTVAGHVTDASGTRAWIARLDRKGSTRWQRVMAGASEAHALLVRSSGKLVVAGRAPNGGGGMDAWLMVADPIGNPVWQRNYVGLDGSDQGGAGALAWTALAAHGTGMLVGGARTGALSGGKAGHPDSAVFARLSAWGHQSCAAGGACATVGFDGCDDGKPCTLDRCDTKSGGCQHATLDGLLCDPKDGCATQGQCSKGACKADPNGKLWSRLYAWEAGSASWQIYAGVGAIAGTPDGGAIVYGHRQANQYAKWPYNGSLGWLRRLDHTGKLLWQRSLTSNDPYAFNGGHKWLLVRGNGEIWAGYQQQGSANGYARNSFVVRTDKSGAALSTLNWKEKVGNNEGGIQAIAEAADGSIGYAIRNQFFRRDPALKKVASKGTPKSLWPTRLVAADQGRWLASGSVSGVGTVALLAPDGTSQWAVSPSGLTGVGIGAVRVGESGEVRLAGWTTSAGSKRKLVVARLAAKSGALQALTTAAELSAGAGVLSALGPAGGFAFLGKWGSGTGHKVRLMFTDGAGELRLSRDLDAGNTASTWAIGSSSAPDVGVMLGGWRIATDGKRRTAISRTGPWGFAPCTAAGLCKGVGSADCDDKNPCTLDTCGAKAGCVHSARSCDDGNACTTDSCDKAKGCVHKPVACSDGLACTQDTCNIVGGGGKKAGCAYPLIPACVDGSACTHDQCGKDGKCANPKVDCDDGNKCTSDWCDKAKGCQHKGVSCDDDQPCTLDTCSKTKGCVFTGLADGAVCKDSEVCAPLGQGICKKLACTHGGKAYVGCTESTPAKSCAEARAKAGGKLDSWIGWTWLEGSGGKARRAWCDMKAGGYERLYTDGVTRAANSWGPGKLMSCSGGVAQSKMWLPPNISVKWGKGTKSATVNAALDVPKAHTSVRVRFRFHITTPNDTYKNWAQATVHLSGKQVFNGGLGGWPKVTGGNNPKAAGSCSPGLGNMHVLQADYSQPHTGGSVALSIQARTSASSISYAWPIGRVEVWVK